MASVDIRLSLPPDWRRGLRLHRSASCATRDPGSNPGSVAAGRDRETHGWRTIGPASSRVGEGMAGRDVAQLIEHGVCNARVVGSIPTGGQYKKNMYSLTVSRSG